MACGIFGLTGGALRLCRDDLGRLLGHLVNRADDEEPGSARKHGCVDDAKALRAMHCEVGGENAPRFLAADGTRA